MLQPEDWVRVLNLIGSVVLFWGSFRGQKWSKRQAKAEDRAAMDRAKAAAADMAAKAQAQAQAQSAASEPARSEDGIHETDPEDFDTAAAEILSRPYFDRFAYTLLCIGFAITSLSSFVDILAHRAWWRDLF